MRILITGGAGFVGSHLAEALLEAATQSTSSTTCPPDASTTSRTSRATPASTTPSTPCSTSRSAPSSSIAADVVFHLAAAVGVKLIVAGPVHTIETNVHGTEVILRHAAKKKKLVFIASTSEVYGKSTDVPFREDADLVLGATTRHRWAYACSKMLDEFHALAYCKERQLPVVIFRLFNTVGPRQTGQYGMVLPTFVRQALAGEPITVFGDGTQCRSFTYVGDVVRRAADADGRAEGHRPGVQHRQRRGSDHPRLAERVKSVTGQRLADRHHPLRAGLRVRIRGHAAAGAGFDEDSRPDRLRAAGRAGRDYPAGSWPASETYNPSEGNCHADDPRRRTLGWRSPRPPPPSSSRSPFTRAG